ncbi:MAG: aminopeptidase P N-terminal domain-containing protein [Planctomycetota bacterium]
MIEDIGITMTAPPNVYRQRRARLAGSLGRPLVIFSGHAPGRNYATNPHQFRAGSSYLYFGGPPVENAAWLIEPGSDGESGCTLLRPPPGPDDALWIGEIPGDEHLAMAAGVPVGNLADAGKLDELVAGRAVAAVCPPHAETLAWMARLGLAAADEDERRAIVGLRNIKDEYELNAMRRAAEVTLRAHRAALAAAAPGRTEADIAAAYSAEVIAAQCTYAFNPIITVRGEVLHTQGYPNKLNDRDLLLVDAGAEEPGGYASDVTRTAPVNGQWTQIQRHLYETAERALRTATAACVPGKRYRDIHDLSARVICEGLVEAELLRGDPAELTARVAHALFYPHGVGHLIGLDGHDMEDFGDVAGYAPGRTRRPEFGNKYVRLDRDLAAGMTVTIEPGIYLVPAIWASAELVGPFADAFNRSKVEALLADNFGGIRIEHTLCVRESGGPEVLSAGLPTGADEVAALVGARGVGG